MGGGPWATGASDRPPITIALIGCAASACALFLLRFTGAAANFSGFVVGALAGPMLLVWFLAEDGARRAAGSFGDWPWPGSQRIMSAVALAGWAAGAAHVWFLAEEMTRWLAG